MAFVLHFRTSIFADKQPLHEIEPALWTNSIFSRGLLQWLPKHASSMMGFWHGYGREWIKDGRGRHGLRRVPRSCFTVLFGKLPSKTRGKITGCVTKSTRNGNFIKWVSQNTCFLKLECQTHVVKWHFWTATCQKHVVQLHFWMTICHKHVVIWHFWTAKC